MTRQDALAVAEETVTRLSPTPTGTGRGAFESGPSLRDRVDAVLAVAAFLTESEHAHAD
ncbi:hypothetical protein JOD54_000813 [Actinokineospora baliensis]|uniref:hypothetical protein n=1 Tax=Actinokineospora baliensis TaxID=547056 RepID=UPI00195D638C|nr:hypothetical protein [Actinokineospora baliensis]MBM7770609.1 hypothetical protein [Actinokineospora baliensis]